MPHLEPPIKQIAGNVADAESLCKIGVPELRRNHDFRLSPGNVQRPRPSHPEPPTAHRGLPDQRTHRSSWISDATQFHQPRNRDAIAQNGRKAQSSAWISR